MLNQDIISEYLKNRDSLNANFNQASLFAPSAKAPGGFVPQPYEPQFATGYPMPQLLASPSLYGFDPGSFLSTTEDYDPANPAYRAGPMQIAQEFIKMGGPIGGIGRGIMGMFEQNQGQMPRGYSGSPVDFGLDAPAGGGYNGPSPIGLPGYSGSTADFGLDAPSITAPSFDPGGWGDGSGGAR